MTTIARAHLPLHDEREALIAWSAVAEPADSDAGALVDALGAVGALAWLADAGEHLAGAGLALAERADPQLAARCLRASERWLGRLELAASPHAARAAAVGATIVVRGDPGWPAALDDLGPERPFALYVRGEAELGTLYDGAVAIVGARSATSYGTAVAAELAAELAGDGRAIVSGGAFGIDAAAHRAALGAGGATLAVMAGGIDRLYPSAHEDLLRRVIEAGAVISEVPPGFAPHRSRFLSRNRLIAAAAVTVVVEAAHRSGALNTAAHAAGLARPVGAVPGPVTSPSSAGCHALIRDAVAVLVATAEDVRELASDAGTWARRPPAGRLPARHGEAADTRLDFDSPAQRAIFDAAGGRGGTTDALARRAGIGVRDALAATGALEARGLLRKVDGVWRRAIKQSEKPSNDIKH